MLYLNTISSTITLIEMKQILDGVAVGSPRAVEHPFLVYEEGGPLVEDANLPFMSIPNPRLKRMHVDATRVASCSVDRREVKWH